MLTSANKLAGTDYSRYLAVDAIDAETIKQAKEIFARYTDHGVIAGGNFEDDAWPVTDEKSRTWIRFAYSDTEYEKHARRWIGCTSGCFRDAAKSYVLFHMGARTLPALREMAFHLCQVAGSDFPDEDGFGEESAQISEFLQLIPGFSEERNAAIECLEDCAALQRIHSGGQRKLLDFTSYFRFHDAIDEYWRGAGEEERRFYFPLYLWWKLTAVLPLRVTEFLMIPKECIRKTEKEYLVTVRRTRLKGGNTLMAYRIDSDYEKKTYPVSPGLAEEILWYKEATKEMEPSPIDSLFCYGPYRERHQLSTGTIYGYDCLKTTKEDFYRYVLAGKGIPVVNLGDTRHISMMNLIISGGSPRMCMELAGHVNIGVSSHYYTNMASLVECSTYELYRKTQKGAAAAIHGSSRYSMEPTEELTEIPGGWCSSPRRRMKQVADCIPAVNSLGEIGDCRCCRYFRRDRQGRHLDFYDTEQGRQKVTADSWFLMHMVEAVRQGIGCQENIRQALLRLQQSCSHYRQCLWNQYRGDGNGEAKENRQ